MRLFKRGSTQEEMGVGRPVFTSDNEAIGYVKAIATGFILVDVPMGRDFWLSDSTIAHHNEKEVVLDFPKDRLDEFKLDEPKADAPIENAFLSEARGSVISDEEQMHQRERMERELAEQRQKLHDN